MKQLPAAGKQAKIMNGTIVFLSSYGYAALFTCVLAEELGLPLPAAPFLLAAGALAGLGRLNLAFALLLAVAASLIGDTVWYYLGRARGMGCAAAALQDLFGAGCLRSSNERGVFQTRYALVVVRQVYPRNQHHCASDGGHLRVSLWKFIAMDGTGTSLWAAVFLFAGWSFGGQVDTIAAHTDRLGGWLGMALRAVSVLYIVSS